MRVEEGDARAPRMGLAVVTYVVTLLASIWIHKTYHVTGWSLALLYAVPLAALAWMIVQARRRRRFTGAACNNRACAQRMLVLGIAYVALLFLATWLHHHFTLSGGAAVGVAILPALPLIGVVWAIGRLILDEKDEYQRMLHVRQMLVATGFMLTVCTIYGFLEQFGQVPHLPAYWAFVVWCGGLGVGTMVNEARS